MSSENNKTFADKDFELATEYDVVRLILKNQEFMANFSEHLHPNLFREPLRPIVDVAIKYWKQYGNVVPIVALAQELNFKIGVNLTDEKFKAIENVLIEVIKQPQAPEYTQKTVSDFIVMQRMENALFDCADIFEKIVKKKDYDSLPEIVKRINIAGEPIIFQKPAFFLGDLDKRTEIRQKILTGEIVRIGIPTSIPKLDSLLPYKGLERGMMGMFLASTGRGKSIALKHCSYAAAMLGMKVAFFSLELPEEMLLDRMDSMVSAVPIMDVLNEHNKVREEIKFVAEQVALPNGFGEIIFQELPPLCNAVSISNELNKLEKRYNFKPDIIIVDYMDLMSSVKRFKEGGWREQQEVARELRALTVKQKSVLWTASQANRGAVNIVEEGGVVSDAESAESYSKQSVADFIVSLNQTKAEKSLPYDPKPMHLFVVKNRVGPGGVKIGIQTAFSRMCFYAGDYDDAKNKLIESINSGAFVEKK
jgi:replicative DNA helicase